MHVASVLEKQKQVDILGGFVAFEWFEESRNGKDSQVFKTSSSILKQVNKVSHIESIGKCQVWDFCTWGDIQHSLDIYIYSILFQHSTKPFLIILILPEIIFILIKLWIPGKCFSSQVYPLFVFLYNILSLCPLWKIMCINKCIRKLMMPVSPLFQDWGCYWYDFRHITQRNIYVSR